MQITHGYFDVEAGKGHFVAKVGWRWRLNEQRRAGVLGRDAAELGGKQDLMISR